MEILKNYSIRTSVIQMAIALTEIRTYLWCGLLISNAIDLDIQFGKEYQRGIKLIL